MHIGSVRAAFARTGLPVDVVVATGTGVNLRDQVAHLLIETSRSAVADRHSQLPGGGSRTRYYDSRKPMALFR
jgi:hypothetical protein